MKKVLPAIIISLILVISAVIVPGAASASTSLPDLIVTEVVPCADSTSVDAFEYIEVANISGSNINLYDYGIAYNATTPDKMDFSTNYKLNPFVPGNFSTNSANPSPFNNPNTCILKPGEIAVIWNWQAHSQSYNNGSGALLEDFRNYYGIDQSITVITAFGNINTTTGDSSHFAIANSNRRCYAIVKTSDFTAAPGNDKLLTYFYIQIGQTDIAELLYATKLSPGTSMLFEITAVAGADTRCMVMTAFDCTPTPGKVTAEQASALAGYLPSGVTLPTDIETTTATVDTSAPEPSVTSAPDTIAPVTSAQDTIAPVTSVKDTSTSGTIASAETSGTPAQTSDQTTKKADNTSGGCGSMFGTGLFALISTLACCGFAIKKKR